MDSPGFGPPPAGFGAPPPPPPTFGTPDFQGGGGPGGYPPPPMGGGFAPSPTPLSKNEIFGPTEFAPQGRPPATPTVQPSTGGAYPPPPAGGPVLAGAAASAPITGEVQRRVIAGFLVSFQDDAFGKFWPLWKGKNLIGRAETGQKVDIEIGHGTTSTHHATIECDGPRFVLTDLGSTNGTFHNEESVGFQGRRDLRDGDKVRFGGFSVIVMTIAARL